MPTLCGVLPLSYVRVVVNRGTLVTHRHSMTFIPHMEPDQWPCGFDGVGRVGFNRKTNASLLAWAALSLFLNFSLIVYYFPVPSFRKLVCAVVVLGLLECQSISQRFSTNGFINNTKIAEIPMPDLYANTILTEMGHGADGTPLQTVFDSSIYTRRGVITSGSSVSNANCKAQYSTAATPKNIADYMLCVRLGSNRQVCEVRSVSGIL